MFRHYTELGPSGAQAGCGSYGATKYVSECRPATNLFHIPPTMSLHDINSPGYEDYLRQGLTIGD